MGLSTNIKAKLSLDMNVNLSVWSAAGADLPTVVTLPTGGSFYPAKGWSTHYQLLISVHLFSAPMMHRGIKINTLWSFKLLRCCLISNQLTSLCREFL